MEKLSGLVLDVYDDREAEVLKTIFATPEVLPELIKQAARITPELERKIPDDLYALVLHDGDVTLRKFACIDGGNTALSVEYFLKTGHKLPVEAQKVAAENLVKACGWYSIEPPEGLTKVALGLGTLLVGSMVAPGAVSAAKQNLSAVKGAGSQIVTPMQRESAKMMAMGAAR
jgi:hypothetical protein